MVKWLAPIVGVVVIGVVIELVTQHGRMGNFIRSIYAFFVLLVLVAPLPKLLGNLDWHVPAVNLVDHGMVEQIQTSGRQAEIEQVLRQMGYPDAVVSLQGTSVYITLGKTVSATEIANIKRQINAAEVTIL